MAYGLPVVATNWSGYRDIVVDRVTGYLTPVTFECNAGRPLRELPIGGRADFHGALSEHVQIDLDVLSQQLLELCTDRSRRERFGAEGARRLTELFLLDDVIQRYREVWKQMRAVMAASSAPDRTIPPCVGFVEVFSGHASDDGNIEHELNLT